MTKRVLTVVALSVALVVPPASAWAAISQKVANKKQVVVHQKIVLGSTVPCSLKNHKWGPLQVELKVSQTISGGKVRSFKILEVTWPIWPQHTVRSVFINKKALPLIQGQVLELQAQAENLEVISGATDITLSFKQSLQAALLAAKTP